MEDEKLSVPVQETGIDPWICDRGTQTEDDYNPQEENTVHVWENAVDQKSLDPARDDRVDPLRSATALHLVYPNGTTTANASSAMGLNCTQNCSFIAITTSGNLEDQAASSSATPCLGAPVNVCTADEDSLFSRLVWVLMKEVPLGKKMACMKEVMEVILKHAQGISSEDHRP